MVEGVDYSWARPDPVKLYAAGKRFAVRYVSSSTREINGVTKNLSQAEADALHAAGVATVTNWEWTATDATKGRDAGVLYATRARDQHAACGGPPDRPIYFSVDFDLGAASAATKDAVREYFVGLRSVLGHERTGIYGGRYAVKLAHDEFWCDWFWQAYAWSNVDTLGWLPYTHLQQYNNGETVAGTPGIDLDRATQDDYGQWGVDMAFTSAQEATLLTAASAINTYLLNMAWRIAALEDGVDVTGGGGTKGQPFWVNRQLKAIAAQLGQIDEATAAALTTKLNEILAAAVAAQNTVTMSDADRAALVADLVAAVPAAIGRELTD